MTGRYLAELMNDSKLKQAISKHARRYSSRVETQEEYIQDAWLRISKQQEGLPIDAYSQEAGRAIVAAYMRSRYDSDVKKKSPKNLNGNGIREVRDPRKWVDLGRGRYLSRQHETLDSWYYPGEWDDWVLVEVTEESADTGGVRKTIQWFTRADAEQGNMYPFYTIDKSFSKRVKVNNIEVV